MNFASYRDRECQKRLGMTHKEDRMSAVSPSCLVSHSGRIAESLDKTGKGSYFARGQG